MSFLRRKQDYEEFDDNEWADLDNLLPKEERAVLNETEAKKAKEAEAAKEAEEPEAIPMPMPPSEEEIAKEREAAERAAKKAEKEAEKEAKKAAEEAKRAEEAAKKAEEEAKEIEEEVSALEEEVKTEDAPEIESPIVVQRKLIAAFLYGTSVLEKRNVVLNASDEAMVLSGMRDGRITDKDAHIILKAIKDPIKKYGEDGVDRRLGLAERERRILAYMTGLGFNDWEQTDGVTIKNFVKRFPLPADFEAASEGFLKVIKNHSDEAGLAEYIKAMENFKQQVYGLRKIYSEQIVALWRKAAEQIKTEAGLIEVSPAEAKLLIYKTVIFGDALVQGQMERKLTTQAIIRNGLAARWKLSFEGQRIALSGAFKAGTRDIVIAYTEAGEKMVARSYYRETDQGVWRYLPDYAIKTNKAGKEEIWCGIGYAEEMFNLPAELQAKLSEIVSKGTIKTLDDPEFLFVGTAKSYPSVEEYLKVRREGKLEGEVYTEVAARPMITLAEPSRHRLKPSELKVEKMELKPNFKEKLFDYSIQTALYGKVKAEVFPSMDGTLKYTFIEDNNHRAWISTIDALSEITPIGLRARWVFAGDLATPVFVTRLSADGFGDENETKGNYISMWKTYIEKIALVKEYLRSKMDRKKVL
ncbi:hypothetical protein IJH02_01395 [Candidatus Saccharibacteria bacterium]|nr:hypothetical protein [Candidatus Saccharibacteria bacterium]